MGEEKPEEKAIEGKRWTGSERWKKQGGKSRKGGGRGKWKREGKEENRVRVVVNGRVVV